MNLMKKEYWDNIQYFSSKENWGDWTKMYYELFLALDKFRSLCNKPIIIHCGYSTTGHTSRSYHYKGMAVDIHVKNMHVLDQFLIANRIDEFNGIGMYPDWSHPGLHLDIRPHKQKFEKDARWIGIYLNGKQSYVSLNTINIKKFII